MRSFTVETGIVAPMDRANVDTDLIIPKQFLKAIGRSGFGAYLFDSIRYMDEGQPGQDCTKRPLNREFPLNESRYANASILLARENFGCGSSREHAPWALEDFGFRCIIAPSFADIFYNNCFKNGILPITLKDEEIKEISEYSNRKEEISINLPDQKITFGNKEINFQIDEFKKKCLLEGLDDIALSLEKLENIVSFEKQIKSKKPWMFND